MKGRSHNVQSARNQAKNGGARQALEYAVAVDTAFKSGDYARKPKVGIADANDAIVALERAIPTAGIDSPTLLAWRGMMLLDSGRHDEAYAEFNRSFQTGPNELAGTMLIDQAGQANRPDVVGPLCAKTVPVVRSDDGKLAMIKRCRRAMNAISPEVEMGWMSPDLVAWYHAESARRASAEQDARQAQADRNRQQQHVISNLDECAASCKERALYCQNDCHHDVACENRCVDINNTCADRCRLRARDRLGE